MDSSQSQHSHPASASDSEPICISSSDLGSNSVKVSSPSAGKHPPELHPQVFHDSESSGSLKTITSTDLLETEEENNVADTTTVTASQGGGKQRGAEELGILTDLYAFYNRFQHYQFTNDMQAFYDRQVRVYRNYETDNDVDKKLCELYENYINVDENRVKFPTDPVDIDIIQHSSWVWSDEKYPNDNHNLDDSFKQEIEDDEMIQDSNDSHKQETDRNDSSKREITGDDDLKLKDPETEDVDMKDSEGWKDSSGNEGGGPSVS